MGAALSDNREPQGRGPQRHATRDSTGRCDWSGRGDNGLMAADVTEERSRVSRSVISVLRPSGDAPRGGDYLGGRFPGVGIPEISWGGEKTLVLWE